MKTRTAICDSLTIGEHRYRVAKPWEAAPYQLITWWDMLEFSADAFYRIGATVSNAIRLLREEQGNVGDMAYATVTCPRPVSTKGRQKLLEFLDYAEQHCSKVSLRFSVSHIQGLRERLADPTLTHDWAIAGFVELENRVFDEMKNSFFMFIPPERATYYVCPTKDWEAVIERFPRTRIDIEEASRSFSCDRYGAAIFHVLLVAEFGVIQVAQLLGVAGDKPGWGCLDRLERIRQTNYKERTPLQQKHSHFLDDTLPLMLAIRDSWRHKISHVDNKLTWLDTDFSPQIAEEIITVTRGFMSRLAGDLPSCL